MALFFFALASAAVVIVLMTFRLGMWWLWPLRALVLIGGLGCLSFGVLMVLAWSGPFFIALHEEGIESRTGSTGSFVPWDSVTATGPYSFAGCDYVGVRTSRPAETPPGWLRAFRMVNRGAAGWHHTYPIFAMPGGRALADYVERCVKDPSARANVARATTP